MAKQSAITVSKFDLGHYIANFNNLGKALVELLEASEITPTDLAVGEYEAILSNAQDQARLAIKKAGIVRL